jgi:hypothetical protein
VRRSSLNSSNAATTPHGRTADHRLIHTPSNRFKEDSKAGSRSNSSRRFSRIGGSASGEEPVDLLSDEIHHLYHVNSRAYVASASSAGVSSGNQVFGTVPTFGGIATRS